MAICMPGSLAALFSYLFQNCGSILYHCVRIRAYNRTPEVVFIIFKNIRMKFPFRGSDTTSAMPIECLFITIAVNKQA